MPRQCTPILRPDPATIQRFLAKVQKSDGCWEWTGYRDARGYGWFKIGGRQPGARMYVTHRVAYAIEHGETPGGEWFVCHRCDNPPCVNPAHLFLGTNSDNQRDAGSKGRHRAQRPENLPPTVKNPSCAARGERNGFALLTAEQVREIYARCLNGETHRSIAADYGVKHGCVQSIAVGRTWSHVTGKRYGE